MCVCIYSYISIYLYLYLYICVCVCVRVGIHRYRYRYIYTHTPTCIYSYIWLCLVSCFICRTPIKTYHPPLAFGADLKSLPNKNTEEDTVSSLTGNTYAHTHTRVHPHTPLCPWAPFDTKVVSKCWRCWHTTHMTVACSWCAHFTNVHTQTGSQTEQRCS